MNILVETVTYVELRMIQKIKPEAEELKDKKMHPFGLIY